MVFLPNNPIFSEKVRMGLPKKDSIAQLVVNKFMSSLIIIQLTYVVIVSYELQVCLPTMLLKHVWMVSVHYYSCF
jgi:hypothetical protein